MLINSLGAAMRACIMRHASCPLGGCYKQHMQGQNQHTRTSSPGHLPGLPITIIISPAGHLVTIGRCGSRRYACTRRHSSHTHAYEEPAYRRPRVHTATLSRRVPGTPAQAKSVPAQAAHPGTSDPKLPRHCTPPASAPAGSTAVAVACQQRPRFLMLLLLLPLPAVLLGAWTCAGGTMQLFHPPLPDDDAELIEKRELTPGLLLVVRLYSRITGLAMSAGY